MATRSANRSSSSRKRSRSASTERSAFNWTSTGVIAGAALGGAALAIAANLGRKYLTNGSRGNWADRLAAEHESVLAIFEKMLATDETQSMQRRMLLMKLGYAIDRHAYAEEHVVYPALREANDTADAKELEVEHGEVKEFLYRLHHMELDDPAWIDTVGDFRNAFQVHAKLEEEQVFPRLRRELDDELDARLTREVNKAEFMMA